jgi:gluconate 2-dehydrogenase gamma chain
MDRSWPPDDDERSERSDRGETRAEQLSRRRFLAAGVAAGATAASAALTAAEARVIKGEMPWAPGEADEPRPVEPGPYVYLTTAEATFVEAAVARLIPADENGPGARETGGAVFIDRQLAGPFGRAERWYMQGPWSKGTPSQGFQSRLTPALMYRAAIKAIDDHCRTNFDQKPFAELAADEQDKILASLEDGSLALDGLDAAAFFKLMLQNTVEGFFADPLYGGNRDMAAWKMIGFPGARYDYREFVGKHGERFPLPPVGILGRPAWTAQKS